MISYKNDNTGSRYSVASKIGMPTTEFIYPPTQKRQIIRGAATKHPDFGKCREIPNTTRLYLNRLCRGMKTLLEQMNHQQHFDNFFMFFKYV